MKKYVKYQKIHLIKLIVNLKSTYNLNTVVRTYFYESYVLLAKFVVNQFLVSSFPLKKIF